MVMHKRGTAIFDGLFSVFAVIGISMLFMNLAQDISESPSFNDDFASFATFESDYKKNEVFIDILYHERVEKLEEYLSGVDLKDCATLIESNGVTSQHCYDEIYSNVDEILDVADYVSGSVLDFPADNFAYAFTTRGEDVVLQVQSKKPIRMNITSKEQVVGEKVRSIELEYTLSKESSYLFLYVMSLESLFKKTSACVVQAEHIDAAAECADTYAVNINFVAVANGNIRLEMTDPLTGLEGVYVVHHQEVFEQLEGVDLFIETRTEIEDIDRDVSVDSCDTSFGDGGRLDLLKSEIKQVNPQFYSGPPASGGIEWKDVQTTRYFTPVYHGAIDGDELRMQGSGIVIDANCVRTLAYYDGRFFDIDDKNARGLTAWAKETASSYRTIAVPPEIDLGTWVYIDYGQYNPYSGWYRAEDRGGAIKGKHFDIFVGVGDQARKDTVGKIPDYAKRIVYFSDGEIHTS